MPKPKGGNKRRRGKGGNGGDMVKRDLVFKEHGQEYAQIVKMLGNGRLDALCYDGKKRMCIIRGAMRKREWMGVGDTILVGLRDFQDGKADVIWKYTMDEARNLKMLGELPSTAKLGTLDAEGDIEEECAFDFDTI